MSRNANDWKTRAVDMDEFGGSRPALKADTIKPADATVITVVDVDKLEINDNDSESGKRVALVLQSREYPDRGFWLNKSGLKTLMEQVSATPAEWVGARVPLVVVRVNNPRTGHAGPSLQVAAPAEWEEVLEAFDAPATRKRKVTPAKPAAKKTAKRAK